MVDTLIQQGPLSIAINAELLQFYKYGAWDPPFCKNTNLDHGVCVCVCLCVCVCCVCVCVVCVYVHKSTMCVCAHGICVSEKE